MLSMPKVKVASDAVANTPVDPTLPNVPVEIGGVTYKLCFDFAALAEAESHFIKQGHKINLLRELPAENLSSTRIIFACAIHKFQPELSYEDALNLVTLPVLYLVAMAVNNAWKESLPEPAPEPKGNPPLPE
jgi:hypothetical protein